MDKGLKEKIIFLRKKGLSYYQIKKKLKCSTGTISHHCKRYKLTHIGLLDTRKTSEKKILKIIEYYKTHSYEETSKKFNISYTTVKKYVRGIVSKKIILTSDERSKRAYLSVKSHRQKTKKRAVEYKGGKCQVKMCGYNKSVYALDFHHINPEKKDFSISAVTKRWETIRKELDKCVLVCRNCHGEIHEEINLKGHSSIVNKIINKKMDK
jgi:DNA-binding CsgD family transcriptional regulator